MMILMIISVRKTRYNQVTELNHGQDVAGTLHPVHFYVYEIEEYGIRRMWRIRPVEQQCNRVA